MKKYIGLLILLIALPINLQATQIGTKQIKDQAITTAKIDDEAVNDTKLEAVLKARIPTTDEKAAMTGANSPSAANVLATMDDITGLDSGVQTVTDGDFITNSGTAKNPILDVDVDDSSEANTQLWTAEKITSELAGKVDQADSALIQHNDLLGKQGGTVDEYYHMTNAQHTRIDELESTDTPVFASINIGSNYQFPPDIGTAAQILKVPAAGTVLEWGLGGGGVQTVTAGNNMTNSGTEADPVLDVYLETEVPLTPVTAGTAGDMKTDSNYLYVCISTNVWKRAELSSWATTPISIITNDGYYLTDSDGYSLITY